MQETWHTRQIYDNIYYIYEKTLKNYWKNYDFKLKYHKFFSSNITLKYIF